MSVRDYIILSKYIIKFMSNVVANGEEYISNYLKSKPFEVYYANVFLTEYFIVYIHDTCKVPHQNACRLNYCLKTFCNYLVRGLTVKAGYDTNYEKYEHFCGCDKSHSDNSKQVILEAVETTLKNYIYTSDFCELILQKVKSGITFLLNNNNLTMVNIPILENQTLSIPIFSVPENREREKTPSKSPEPSSPS